MSYTPFQIVYRGFTYHDLYNLVQSGQAAAMGHGSGVTGALNWMDNCRRATGVQITGEARKILINNLSVKVDADLTSDAHRASLREEYDRYH
jgi:hypothetical protein